jgi:Flp pilus assembly protein TadB
MLDSWTDVLLRVFGAGWVGLFAGLVTGGWTRDTMVTALIYAAVMAAVGWLAWEAPPGDEAAELWEDLGLRDRRRVARALKSRRDPADPRLARITRTVRAYAREDHDEPGRRDRGHAVWMVALVAVVVVAALRGAPPGWVVAGALLPAAAVALRIRDRGRARPAAA